MNHSIPLRRAKAVDIGELAEPVDQVGVGAGIGDIDRIAQRDPVPRRDRDVEQRIDWGGEVEIDEGDGPTLPHHDVLQTEVSMADQLTLSPGRQRAVRPVHPCR
jgi:hypothetical protein